MENQAMPALTGFGSDVGTGNAEICLVTAKFLISNSDIVCLKFKNSG